MRVGIVLTSLKRKAVRRVNGRVEGRSVGITHAPWTLEWCVAMQRILKIRLKDLFSRSERPKPQAKHILSRTRTCTHTHTHTRTKYTQADKHSVTKVVLTRRKGPFCVSHVRPQKECPVGGVGAWPEHSLTHTHMLSKRDTNNHAWTNSN